MLQCRHVLVVAVVAFHAFLVSPVSAYVSLYEIKADDVAKWLSLRNFRIRTEQRGASWRFVVMCPPVKPQELQWGMSLCLKQNGVDVAQVAVKPRVILEAESKQLAGWLAFELMFSNELLEGSRILAYVEQSKPDNPWSGPHIYESISVKDLLAAAGR